jgi:hypothetical protein
MIARIAVVDGKNIEFFVDSNGRYRRADALTIWYSGMRRIDNNSTAEVKRLIQSSSRT